MVDISSYLGIIGWSGSFQPLFAYLLILITANIVRFILVIRPLWKLSKKYDRKWRREMFFGSKTKTSSKSGKEIITKNPSLMKELLEGQMDPIKGFLVRETIYFLV